MINWLGFIVGTILIALGVFVFVASVYGNYKFKYVCNRMHASAMGDTLGLLSVLAGLMCFKTFDITSWKLVFVVLFFWLTSPVCSHLLVRMEVTTNEKLDEEMEVIAK